MDPYLDLSPAHIVMLCGVFGNISIEDVHITISTVAGLLTPDGVVIWTRGVDEANDVTGTIRQFFKDAGFDELTFVAPADETFRVGMHRLRTYQHVRPEVGTRMFTFVK